MSAAPAQNITPLAQVDQDGVEIVHTNVLQKPDANQPPPEPTSKSIGVTPVPDAVTVEVAVEPDGQVDCAGSYIHSFRPFCCDILCNPIGHFTGKALCDDFCGGVATLFKTCKPKDDEETMKLIGTWAAIKLWFTFISAFLMFFILGLVIGGIAMAIMNVFFTLIIGFFFTHMIWWLSTRMHGCCGPIGFLILGIACLVGALFNLISFFMGIPLLSWFPVMTFVYLFDLVLMVPAIYMGSILLQYFQAKKNGGVAPQNTADVAPQNTADVIVVHPVGTVATVPQMGQGPQCTNCHKVLEPGAAFCEGCGVSQN